MDADTAAGSDHRVYAAMLHTLRLFLEGSTSLKACIDELTPLIGQLHDADPDWLEQFSSQHEALQETFERCVERQSPLTNDEYLSVKEIVRDMKAMVSDVIGWSDDEKQAIRLIVSDRRADLVPSLDAGFVSGFSSAQVSGIREALREEIAENGYQQGSRDDWGELLEDFVDRITPRTND